MSFIEDQGIDYAGSPWRDVTTPIGNQRHSAITMVFEIVQQMTDMDIIDDVAFTGVGDGSLETAHGGVDTTTTTQTWTIEFLTPTTFSVTGSESGAQNNGATDTHYNTNSSAVGGDVTSKISFYIRVGSTAFQAGDVFTIEAAGNPNTVSDAWILDRWSGTLFGNGLNDGLWWHGVGDGSEAIYTGMRYSVDAASQEWILETACATGYDSNANWDAQPGISPISYTPMWNGNVHYWLVWNTRRFVLQLKSSTVFYGLYQGLFLPFGSPNEYPYPIANIGGSASVLPWTSLDSADLHNIGMSNNGGFVRDLDGTWLVTRQSSTGEAIINLWPNGALLGSVESVWDNHRNFENGDHQLFPVTLMKMAASPTTSYSETSPYGVLDGVRRITGFGQGTETSYTIDGDDHIAFQDGGRNDVEDFIALELS